MEVLNKHFWGDFEGNPRPKHPLKHFSQRWRSNWGDRCPVTERQRLSMAAMAPNAHLWIFFTPFCSELALDVNMKVLAMNVSFLWALVLLYYHF